MGGAEKWVTKLKAGPHEWWIGSTAASPRAVTPSVTFKRTIFAVVVQHRIGGWRRKVGDESGNQGSMSGSLGLWQPPRGLCPLMSHLNGPFFAVVVQHCIGGVAPKSG